MKIINVTIGNNSNTSQKGKICQHTFNKTENGAKEYSFLWNSIYSCSVVLTDSLFVYFPWPVFIRVTVNAGIITEAAERQWEYSLHVH